MQVALLNEVDSEDRYWQAKSSAWICKLDLIMDALGSYSLLGTFGKQNYRACKMCFNKLFDLSFLHTRICSSNAAHLKFIYPVE